MARVVHVSTDDTRSMFSAAMSDMYRSEVPQYGALLELVHDANARHLQRDPALKASLARAGELERLGTERHAAIRLGTTDELATIRRAFAVLGLAPVGYYDLSVAGVPVHATAFRPVRDESLRRNPFRVFTSLLRLELIDDKVLRAEAAAILSRRRICTPRVLELIDAFERNGGLSTLEAEEFVREAIQTFRWHREATVSHHVYKRFRTAHPLVADVVCFKGPHINHLTPRTLDIDEVQSKMPVRGISPKAVIEGPPRRNAPILLRQTSFKALEEAILFQEANGSLREGTHTARFGEIEQRGVALTTKGRKLYDELLVSTRREAQAAITEYESSKHNEVLADRFQAFPDDWTTLRTRGLAFFRYSASQAGIHARKHGGLPPSLEALIERGYVVADPIIYEDFLPVSAAGIFQSNLGAEATHHYTGRCNRPAFEAALGAPLLDEICLYAQIEAASIKATFEQLGLPT